MKEHKKEVCVLAAAGMLGSSFDKTGFYHALEQKPDVMGCDSGTSDSGPFYPGAGKPRMNRKAAKRDLELMITEGVRRGIPVLIGSAGTAGADPNVDWLVEIAREIAAEQKLHFKLAEIKTELTHEQLRHYMEEGRLHPLEGAPEFTDRDLDTLTRCISVIGAEPFIKALEEGAQVVIAGRSTDTSIYAAVPTMYGLGNGFAWHAAKVLECGTLASVFEKYHGSMLAWVREDSASIEPGHPEMAASPVSIASHTLYENSNPFRLQEPGVVLDTEAASYDQETDRRVKITGTRLISAPYTIKLEGVKFEGYRRVAVAGVSDPLILKQFDTWLEACEGETRNKIRAGMGLEPEDYRMRRLVYGNPKDPDTECVGVVFDIIAKNPEDADGIISNVWHTALHVPIREWEGAQSQTAFPFSPPTLMTQENGATYSFCLNHVIEVEDPLETCRFTYYDL
ncbi:MAG: acyclic terpene utilization AtuA family protein [Enterocloster asparagiformis]|nr:acyclic terpene utilization AtuA family protein [Enterocloster asparagiformis]